MKLARGRIQFKTKFSNEISSFESGYINLSNKFDTSDPTDRILGQMKNLLVAPSSLAKSRSLIPLCTQQTGQEYFGLKRLTVACGFWRLCVFVGLLVCLLSSPHDLALIHLLPDLSSCLCPAFACHDVKALCWRILFLGVVSLYVPLFFGDSWSDNKIIRKKQRKGWPCECIGSRARLQLGRSNGQNWLRVTQVHMFHTGSSFSLYSGLNHEWIETFLIISGFWLDSASILVLIGSIYLKWWTVHSWAGSETSDGPWICIMCIRCIRCCIHQRRTCKWLLRTSYVFQWKKRPASMLPSTTTFQATKQLIRAELSDFKTKSEHSKCIKWYQVICNCLKSIKSIKSYKIYVTY